MTFSQNVKNEIVRSLRNLKGCCVVSFLKGVLKSGGSLSLNSKGFSFTVESDNYDFLELCKTLAERELNVECNISSYNVNAKGTAVYSCEFFDNIGAKLGLTSLQEDGSIRFCDKLKGFVSDKPCCKRSFMQGAFLARGSVVVPDSDWAFPTEQKTSGQYHLELRLSDAEFAEYLMKIYDWDFRLTQRKNYFVPYLKDSEKIADFLTYLNARVNRLQLDKIMIERSVRNDANRQSNCIAANIGKSVDASANQLEAIKIIRQKGYFEALPDKLKEIACMREEYPEASLDEIAKRLSISKSGASHRFAKLKEISLK